MHTRGTETSNEKHRAAEQRNCINAGRAYRCWSWVVANCDGRCSGTVDAVLCEVRVGCAGLGVDCATTVSSAVLAIVNDDLVICAAWHLVLRYNGAVVKAG